MPVGQAVEVAHLGPDFFDRRVDHGAHEYLGHVLLLSANKNSLSLDGEGEVRVGSQATRFAPSPSRKGRGDCSTTSYAAISRKFSTSASANCGSLMCSGRRTIRREPVCCTVFSSASNRAASAAGS